MDKREAAQTLGMINEYHFKANPEPVTEEWLSYCREERDKRIAMLKADGFEVELQTGDSLEHCGRYVLKEQSQSPTKGRGCIKVSASLMRELNYPVMRDEWRKALLLPDAYEIERVERVADVFHVYVLHEAIPVDGDHITQTEVVPFLCVDTHEGKCGLPYLSRIEIKQWDGNRWQVVAVTDERKPADSPLARE